MRIWRPTTANTKIDRWENNWNWIKRMQSLEQFSIFFFRSCSDGEWLMCSNGWISFVVKLNLILTRFRIAWFRPRFIFRMQKLCSVISCFLFTCIHEANNFHCESYALTTYFESERKNTVFCRYNSQHFAIACEWCIWSMANEPNNFRIRMFLGICSFSPEPNTFYLVFSTVEYSHVSMILPFSSVNLTNCLKRIVFITVFVCPSPSSLLHRQ